MELIIFKYVFCKKNILYATNNTIHLSTLMTIFDFDTYDSAKLLLYRLHRFINYVTRPKKLLLHINNSLKILKFYGFTYKHKNLIARTVSTNSSFIDKILSSVFVSFNISYYYHITVINVCTY